MWTKRHYMQRIKLGKEFEWLLGEDFKKLCQGFKPVDYRPFMKEESPIKKVINIKNPFSIGQVSIFWRVFEELEDNERRSNPSQVDKTTISEEKLQDGLVSTGRFSQSDAAMIIKTMKDEGLVEQVSWGTLRRVV